MAFRANEQEQQGYSYLMNRLTGPSIDPEKREESKRVLADIVDRYGPVVNAYPLWHPLVAAQDSRGSVIVPSEQCGYKGLDHTYWLRNAFITCPYHGVDEVLASVEKVSQHPFLEGVAEISAEKIDAQLYADNAHPILVKCDWKHEMERDGTIPAGVAVALMLEQQVPCWRWSQVGESWKTMCPYLLGQPHGSRSSLFVSQDTGQQIKDIWNAIINTGMFGNIRVGLR